MLILCNELKNNWERNIYVSLYLRGEKRHRTVEDGRLESERGEGKC
jgi:hypothetical protein